MIELIYVGLGSNLGDRGQHLTNAIESLRSAALPGTMFRSGLYRSEPVGPAGQRDYLNAAVSFQSSLEPHALLERLFEIERAGGRVRAERWGPRTIDLDLLLYGERRIEDAHLVVPHPRIRDRAFVLYPLLDLVQDLYVPGQGQLRDLIERCPPLRLERLPWSR